jgi:plastocyanin
MSTIASSFWRWVLAGSAVGVIVLALVVLESDGAAAQPGTAALTMRAKKSVDISHFAFHPPTLTVGVGTKVAFVNSSGIAHTATRTGSFNTGHIKPGSSVVVRFTHAGTFAYHCMIHPFMHGKIVVQ